MKHGDAVYLRHMLDAIAKVEAYLHGIDEVAFAQQSLVQDGVIRQIEIIGEAVKHLTPELHDRYGHIPWRDIAGMRDKLIHHYFSVDIQAVWLTATTDLPTLKAEVQTILHEIETG